MQAKSQSLSKMPLNKIVYSFLKSIIEINSPNNLYWSFKNNNWESTLEFIEENMFNRHDGLVFEANFQKKIQQGLDI